MKNSLYKDEILEILSREHLLSIADIQKKVSADFSTVFRNLESLVKDNIVKKVLISKDVVMYEIKTEASHDHFVCDDCGSVASVTFPYKKKQGVGHIHDIVMRGTCKACL